jgi:hypothetical protein
MTTTQQAQGDQTIPRRLLEEGGGGDEEEETRKGYERGPRLQAEPL